MFRVGRILSSSLLILLVLTVAVQADMAYSIRSHTICKDIDESTSPDTPIDPTHTFYDTDRQVCSLVVLENLDHSIGISTKWFTPAGDLFKKIDEVIELPDQGAGEYWEFKSTNSKLFLQAEDADAKGFLGQWRIEFYISDEFQFTDSFELKSTSSTNTAVPYSYSIRSYTTCRGVDESEYPYEPIDSTTVFYDTDEMAICLVILENVYGSHIFEGKFFDPDGNLYDSVKVEVSDPRTQGHDYWTSFSVHVDLPIMGTDVENLPGQWRIEAYLDNQLKFQIDFKIVSTKTTTQTTSKYVVQTAEWTMPTVITSVVASTVAEPFFLTGNTLMVVLGLVAIVVIAGLLLVMRSRRKPHYEPRHGTGLPESI